MNCVVPVAGSRMTETVLPADMLKLLDPAHITPIVTYLAHESSEHSGSCFEVGGGWYSQVCSRHLPYHTVAAVDRVPMRYLDFVP